MELHEFIIQTENQVRAHESHFPPKGISRVDWSMWLPKKSFPSEKPKLEFRKVESEQDWESMYRLRIVIEKEFGIFDSNLVNGFIQDIKVKTQNLTGRWYLVFSEGEVVGQIGIIPFDFGEIKIGRLQDVDIVPTHQKKGLGHHLLLGICHEAQSMGLEGICLFARADGWVKNWYERFGFVKIGEMRK